MRIRVRNVRGQNMQVDVVWHWRKSIGKSGTSVSTIGEAQPGTENVAFGAVASGTIGTRETRINLSLPTLDEG